MTLGSRVHLFAALIAVIMCCAALCAMNAAASDQSVKAWQPRLEALKPAEPVAYFELAEEVADIAAEPAQRELARHLFALAGVLDPDHLGRSACLALADLEENPSAKRRLLALASLLGSGMEGANLPNASATTESDPTAALAAAEALSYYRKGKGAQALNALRKPGAEDLLRQYERMLPGGLARFKEDCKLYKGQQKPTLSSSDITRMLRFEAALLSGGERSWSGELLLTTGQPLIEVDPDRLEESLGVDGKKNLWRGGRWVEK